MIDRPGSGLERGDGELDERSPDGALFALVRRLVLVGAVVVLVVWLVVLALVVGFRLLDW